MNPSVLDQLRDVVPPVEMAGNPGLFYFFIIVSILLVAFALYFIRKRYLKLTEGGETQQLSACETASAKIAELKKSNHEEVRAYLLLSNALREYLSNKFLLKALDMTTEELTVEISKFPEITEKERSLIHDILVKCDYVKFSQNIQEESSLKNLIELFETFIQKTN